MILRSPPCCLGSVPGNLITLFGSTAVDCLGTIVAFIDFPWRSFKKLLCKANWYQSSSPG